MSTCLIAATALSWCFLGVGAWLGWQLLRQNGRILLRLDELEKRLDEFEFDESSSSRCEQALTGSSEIRDAKSEIDQSLVGIIMHDVAVGVEPILNLMIKVNGQPNEKEVALGWDG